MDDQMVIHGFIIPFLLAKTMSKTSFLFSLIFTSLFLFSCRKENYVQLLRSENNRLTSSNGKYTTLYSIHTVKGTLLDIYRDANGFINIYKKRLVAADLPLVGNLEIKNSKGAICKLITFDLKHLDHVVTMIKGQDPIKILQGKVILFEEGKRHTTAGSIYTIRSETTSVEVKQEKVINGQPCYINGVPLNANKKRQTKHVISYLITIYNNKPGFRLNDEGHEGILIKTTDDSYRFNDNNIVKNSTLTTGLKGDVISISNKGIYLFNTVEPKSIEKREIENSSYPCRTNMTEEFIYDINTAAYATSPVGSGTFSIYRMLDGKIIVYHKNAYGPGNSSVNYEICTTNYKISATLKDEPPFSFNEATFSLNESEKADTKLNGLITVKRNGVVLFDELEEVKKKITTFCTTGLYSRVGPHHRAPRGIGRLFYPLPYDGSPLVLRVKFINGCPHDYREFIRNAVREWETYANVQFDFLEDNSTEDAEIRIDIGTGLPDDDKTTQSALGVEGLRVPSDRPTMRLPLVTYNGIRLGSTTEALVRRAILHEFGHALGLEHEHQNPHSQIHWNKIVVYLTHTLNGASLDQVDSNLFQALDGPAFSNSGQYDPHSIMNYHFPAPFIIGASACPPTSADSILNLSDGDKAFIARIYPKPVSSTEFNSRGSGSGREEKTPHRKKPEYTDTTNEPPSFE